MIGQTWNNILNSIKRKLGAKLNLLELSDEEIISGLQEDVMPFLSQFFPLKRSSMITANDLILDTVQPLYSVWSYKIPIKPETEIIDIYDVYISPTSSGSNDDPFYGTKYAGNPLMGTPYTGTSSLSGIEGSGLIDVVISNEFLSMLSSLQTKLTWEFFKPDILVFDADINQTIVVYNTIHETPETIMSDMFQTIFKPYCIMSVLRWIAALRTKYTSMATPMGEISLNWEKLEQDADKIEQKITPLMNTVPLDHFLHII